MASESFHLHSRINNSIPEQIIQTRNWCDLEGVKYEKFCVFYGYWYLSLAGGAGAMEGGVEPSKISHGPLQ